MVFSSRVPYRLEYDQSGATKALSEKEAIRSARECAIHNYESGQVFLLRMRLPQLRSRGSQVTAFDENLEFVFQGLNPRLVILCKEILRVEKSAQLCEQLQIERCKSFPIESWREFVVVGVGLHSDVYFRGIGRGSFDVKPSHYDAQWNPHDRCENREGYEMAEDACDLWHLGKCEIPNYDQCVDSSQHKGQIGCVAYSEIVPHAGKIANFSGHDRSESKTRDRPII